MACLLSAPRLVTGRTHPRPLDLQHSLSSLYKRHRQSSGWKGWLSRLDGQSWRPRCQSIGLRSPAATCQSIGRLGTADSKPRRVNELTLPSARWEEIHSATCLTNLANLSMRMMRSIRKILMIRTTRSLWAESDFALEEFRLHSCQLIVNLENWKLYQMHWSKLKPKKI